MLVLQATNTGVRRLGNDSAIEPLLSGLPFACTDNTLHVEEQANNRLALKITSLCMMLTSWTMIHYDIIGMTSQR